MCGVFFLFVLESNIQLIYFMTHDIHRFLWFCVPSLLFNSLLAHQYSLCFKQRFRHGNFRILRNLHQRPRKIVLKISKMRKLLAVGWNKRLYMKVTPVYTIFSGSSFRGSKQCLHLLSEFTWSVQCHRIYRCFLFIL